MKHAQSLGHGVSIHFTEPVEPTGNERPIVVVDAGRSEWLDSFLAQRLCNS